MKKPKWPTLKGRLSQRLTDELEALEQLEKTTSLTDFGKRRLAFLRKKKCKTKHETLVGKRLVQRVARTRKTRLPRQDS